MAKLIHTNTSPSPPSPIAYIVDALSVADEQGEAKSPTLNISGSVRGDGARVVCIHRAGLQTQRLVSSQSYLHVPVKREFRPAISALRLQPQML